MLPCSSFEVFLAARPSGPLPAGDTQVFGPTSGAEWPFQPLVWRSSSVPFPHLVKMTPIRVHSTAKRYKGKARKAGQARARHCLARDGEPPKLWPRARRNMAPFGRGGGPWRICQARAGALAQARQLGVCLGGRGTRPDSAGFAPVRPWGSAGARNLRDCLLMELEGN